MTERGYSALERETVSLLCQAFSNPPSQYVWFYNNSQVYAGPQYTINRILRMQTGHYACLAQNTYLNTRSRKTITLTVYCEWSQIPLPGFWWPPFNLPFYSFLKFPSEISYTFSFTLTQTQGGTDSYVNKGVRLQEWLIVDVHLEEVKDSSESWRYTAGVIVSVLWQVKKGQEAFYYFVITPQSPLHALNVHLFLTYWGTNNPTDTVY